MTVRVVLVAVGVAMASYGAMLLLRSGPDALRSIVVWFAAGILLHDGLFAPLCAAVGLGGRRWLPRRWWAPVACGAVCTVTLLAVAVPTLTRGGALPNPTVLDRNYPVGLAVALALVWGLVVVAAVAGSVRKGGRAEER